MLIATSLSMCKSKEKIPVADTINYTIILQENVALKRLENAIDHKVIDANRSAESYNQWSVDFLNEGKKSENIKRDLLNLDMVISVLTIEQLKKMNSKGEKEGSVSPIKRKQKQ